MGVILPPPPPSTSKQTPKAPIQIRVMRLKIERKKNHHYTVKVFIVFKFQGSPAPLMGIWICAPSDRIKSRAFWQISFKGKHLVIVIALVIQYYFETTVAIVLKLCQWRCFSVFIVKLEYISHLFLVFIVDFEQLCICRNWTINV